MVDPTPSIANLRGSQDLYYDQSNNGRSHTIYCEPPRKSRPLLRFSPELRQSLRGLYDQALRLLNIEVAPASNSVLRASPPMLDKASDLVISTSRGHTMTMAMSNIANFKHLLTLSMLKEILDYLHKLLRKYKQGIENS
jgi:hypothetical protein